MKKFITISLFVLLAWMSVFAATPDFTNETVSYKVMYKWGLINKQAGRATINIRHEGDKYLMALVARSEPWADKFFCVRDTLIGSMNARTFTPIIYEKMSHEGAEDKHDVVRFERHGNTVTGYCTRRVIKKGQLKIDDSRVLKAEGVTVDMLSSFYYMRSLPFDKWHQGQQSTINIFSGKRKELLTFKYHGIEDVKIDGKVYRCYHITFIFTGDGGRKSSDDMDAWLTADSRRLPVQLEGKLPVGKVRCQIMDN
ncbi:MAG: DUF3108 domain-containing protein [Bacteroidales bacterium]|nr:DUF3108 domain-containing protein [Bacteroidales bacterium]